MRPLEGTTAHPEASVIPFLGYMSSPPTTTQCPSDLCSSPVGVVLIHFYMVSPKFAVLYNLQLCPDWLRFGLIYTTLAAAKVSAFALGKHE